MIPGRMKDKMMQKANIHLAGAVIFGNEDEIFRFSKQLPSL
jgi:hypothetical protein